MPFTLKFEKRNWSPEGPIMFYKTVHIPTIENVKKLAKKLKFEYIKADNKKIKQTDYTLEQQKKYSIGLIKSFNNEIYDNSETILIKYKVKETEDTITLCYNMLNEFFGNIPKTIYIKKVQTTT